jgi:hypothetical protein
VTLVDSHGRWNRPCHHSLQLLRLQRAEAGQGKPLAAPLQIPKPLNKPGPGLSPKGQPMLSRSPSIQELLLSEDGDDDGGGVGGAQRLRRLSERTASKESLHTSPSKESLKGCALTLYRDVKVANRTNWGDELTRPFRHARRFPSPES